MLEALLFDLDGTLADTDPIHMRAWQRLLQDYGIEVDEAFYRQRISGRLNPRIVEDLLPQLDAAEGEALIERKEAEFRAEAGHLERLAGLDEIFAWARDAGLRLGLVTNAPRENARFMLAALELDDAFETIVRGDEASAGKPDPAPYLLALERMEIAADVAVAFEDSWSGVAAADRAGIPVIGITTTHPPAELRDAGARQTAPDFRDPGLWRYLRSRLQQGEPS